MTRSLASLEREARLREVVLPADGTVAKYGWTRLAWLRMLAKQDWRCPICTRVPRTGKFVTDHEHVPGWKHMPDRERARYVRGLTCWSCNRYLLARGISADVARNVAAYLETYAKRRPA